MAEAFVGGPKDLTVFVDEKDGDGLRGVGGYDALVGADKIAAWLSCFDLRRNNDAAMCGQQNYAQGFA